MSGQPKAQGSAVLKSVCRSNLLTDNQPPYDPAMGTYQLRALLCRVPRVVPTEAQTSADTNTSHQQVIT
jgi:hypothetical protein